MLLNNHREYFVSVISDNPKSIFFNLELFKKSGISGIHFDVMDGLFVPRLGLYPEMLRAIRESTDLFIEVHTMLMCPSNFLSSFVESGADRIIFHVETEENLEELVQRTRDLGVQVGLAINPSTSISRLAKFLELINQVVVMAINPGVPKHPFIESTYARVSQIRDLVESINPQIHIEIDGGVTFTNQKKLFELGANILVCGSGTVFKPNNAVAENLRLLFLD